MTTANTLLTAHLMRKALTELADELSRPVTLIMGGGGAMILAHAFALGTTDIDAVPQGMSIEELDPFVKSVAARLGIAPDWLNPYFSTFTHTLPADYGTRLIEVFNYRGLSVLALGRMDLLIMKCFAHRQKDVGHARALIKAGVDRRAIEKHLEALLAKRIPGAELALDFLDEVWA